MIFRRSGLLGLLCGLALVMTSHGEVLGKLELINGRLVDVVDECSREVPDSCGPGRCCVTQYLGYAAASTKRSDRDSDPEMRLMCQEVRQEGATCFTDTSVKELCPCGTGLVCEPASFNFFGYCRSDQERTEEER